MRIGATVARVPRAADSSEIGMGAMKSGLAMEYAAAVEKGEFWVTHLFAVRYPNRPMHLAYGFGPLETVLGILACADVLCTVICPAIHSGD